VCSEIVCLNVLRGCVTCLVTSPDPALSTRTHRTFPQACRALTTVWEARYYPRISLAESRSEHTQNATSTGAVCSETRQHSTGQQVVPTSHTYALIIRTCPPPPRHGGQHLFLEASSGSARRGYEPSRKSIVLYFGALSGMYRLPFINATAGVIPSADAT
jgi:hypothetical protein